MGHSLVRATWVVLIAVLISLVFSYAVYRAATQSITVDEAHVFEEYIYGNQHASKIFKPPFTSENHVLQTFLAFESVKLFGITELSLRLPSLIAALAYMLAVIAIATFVFHRVIHRLLAAGLMLLNPMIVDHFSLARGYGIALAFFTWSLYLSLRYLRFHNGWRKLTLAGVCLALGVSSNLVFLAPSIGLALVFIALAARESAFRKLALGYVLPGVIVTAASLARLMISAHRNDFYFGIGEFRHAVEMMAEMSFAYGRLHIGNVPVLSRIVAFLSSVEFWIVLSLLLIIAISAILVCRSKEALKSPAAICLVLTAGPLLFAFLFLTGSHWLTGLKFPYGRTGLYFYALLSLSCVCLADMGPRLSRFARYPAGTLLAALSLALVLYGAGFFRPTFMEWPFCAGTREMLQRIPKPDGSARITIGGSTVYHFPVDFYRHEFDWVWLDEFGWGSLKPGDDYYLFMPGDSSFIQTFNLKTIYATEHLTLAAKAGP